MNVKIADGHVCHWNWEFIEPVSFWLSDLLSLIAFFCCSVVFTGQSNAHAKSRKPIYGTPTFRSVITVIVYKIMMIKKKTINEWVTCAHCSPSNDVSFEAQQHCSLFNQKAWGQIPSRMSFIQAAPISITPAEHSHVISTIDSRYEILTTMTSRST